MAALTLLAGSIFAQRYGYRECSIDADTAAMADTPREWVFARLRYRGMWDVDYACAETHLSTAVTRLTRVDVQPGGRVVEPGSEDLFKYPWLYAVEVHSWSFTPAEAANMREYLLRGGFLMVDDFHGEAEWYDFEFGMKQIFPERPIVDIPADDPVYRTPYPIEERVQVPGPGFMRSGVTYEKGGVVPHWRGIRDDKGRWMVVISHNIDYGEGWEQADNPAYPEEFTGQAYEIAIDYLIYSMTH